MAFVLATPNYQLIHDAIDYDRHAASIAQGHGFAPLLRAPDRVPPAGLSDLRRRRVQARRHGLARPIGCAPPGSPTRCVGTALVALIGLIAFQLWGRREALVALALGAIYIPLILVGQSVMSEPLFVVCLLGAIAAVLHKRSYPLGDPGGGADGPGDPRARQRPDPARAAGLRGVEAAEGLRRRRSCSSSPRLLTVAPWTIRNAVTLHAFVPVSTQFGSALAGTYNSEARADKVNPASWRTLKRVDDYRPIFNQIRSTPEPVLEKQLRKASIEFIKDHPAYVLTVGYWTTRRMLDLAGMDWSHPHRRRRSRRPRGWAIAGVICFWIFALLAIFGATPAGRGPRRSGSGRSRC